MDARRLVWVRTGDPKGFGSGYLIGPQLVLTALHVVLSGRRWALRVQARVGHPRFGGVVHRQAEVCWPDPLEGVPAKDALDMALLWLEEPVPVEGGPVRWGRPGGGVPLPFEGAGFPAFADEAARGDVEHLRGELPVVSTSSSDWVLDCRVWPNLEHGGERPWAGASGTAIFCRDRLVGVAVEDNRPMGGRRLQAAPVHEALSLPGFADLVTRHGHPGTTVSLEEVTAAQADTERGEDVGTRPVVPVPIPPLATAFQPRSVLRDRIDAAWSDNRSVVLTQERPRVLSGGGGVGKTQLAAAYAMNAVKNRTYLVLWVAAADVQQVITRYAQTAVGLELPGAGGEDPEADARLLLDWLRTTHRRWLVVLDDITDPHSIQPLWPASQTGSGRVLATTRSRDASLTGNGRIRIDIDVYTPAESDTYLRQRLDVEEMGHLLGDHATQLTHALGHHPLGLSMAAAHMINEELTSTQYLNRYNDRHALLEELMPPTADTEGYHKPKQPTQVTAALLLSLDAVQANDTTGLATTALRLTALLDPAGHPHALWNTPALLDHLTAHHTPAPHGDPSTSHAPATAEQAHSALRLLHRYALLTCDTRAEPRAVSIHALTARATRETIPADEIPALATAAADGILKLWPDLDQHHAEHAAVLRANTSALSDHTNDCLWSPDGHPVLYRAGNSLINAGLAASATAYWQSMTTKSERLLGGQHPDTLTARANLANSYWHAGRTGEAVELLERVVADLERLHGGEHPDTLTARANLAASYQQAGHTREAIELLEQVVADRERLHGGEHPDTLTARANLAGSYRQAGRTGEAIAIEEGVVADRERLQGGEHPYTLTARGNLASSYWQAGRTGEAIELLERVVADLERLQGGEHPDTLTARANLATSYRQAGRTGEAIAIEEGVAADLERLQGGEHPSTLTARANLATSYRQAGRTDEAIELLERVVADRERLQGDEHPSTLTARGNLASSYWHAGRTGEAIAIEEGLVADLERLQGGEHPDTLTARANLATSYRQAGRTGEAIELLEQAVTDRERLHGGEHPDSLTARANLATSYWHAGRIDEAIELLKGAVAGLERLLGDEHPDTLTARANLATSYQQAGRTDEAIELLKRVVTDRERLLGDEHPSTLTARANLATSYQQAGRISEAIELLERVVTDRERLLGDEHPSTLTARGNLASSYWQAGRIGEAIELLEQVVADLERLLGDEHPDTRTARANLARALDAVAAAAAVWQPDTAAPATAADLQPPADAPE
ncbi:FxSxx-COOH system tetratricopeptide repeat protein [Streptomyces sp. NPDC001544]|uniref:FxSxx-COOH system tetratricopeptide repeat protein n=1 Tax=Streptomyces sp. NPDC001544 TaxID=3364584 RepID=UPI0036BA0EAD